MMTLSVMPKRVVVNASPMIALLGIGQEQLLCGLFDRVLLPQAVRDEIEAGQAKDDNVARLIHRLLAEAGEIV